MHGIQLEGELAAEGLNEKFGRVLADLRSLMLRDCACIGFDI